MKWAGNIVVLGRHYDIVGLATQAGMPMVVEGERRVLFVLGAGTAGFGSFQSEDREWHFGWCRAENDERRRASETAAA